MKGKYSRPSELLKKQKETGLSYWDLIGRPLYDDGKDDATRDEAEQLRYSIGVKLDNMPQIYDPVPTYDDGKDERPNLYREDQTGKYFYQESENSPKVYVTPVNKTLDNPAYWTYIDDNGREYTPKKTPIKDSPELSAVNEGDAYTKKQLANEAATRPIELAPYITDFNTTAAMASQMLPYPFNMFGNTYFSAKGASNLNKGNYLEGALDTAFGLGGAVRPAVKTTANAVNSSIISRISPALENENTVYKTIRPLEKDNININEKEHGYQRMKDFISSPEYQQRLENAGLGNYKNYMINLIERRLNGKGYFPARKSDNMRHRGMSEVDPSSADYGITVRSDLQGTDFLHTLDHELAHWSTENTPTGILKNVLLSFITGHMPNFKLQKLIKANDKIAPLRTWKDYFKSRYGDLSKKELKTVKDEIKEEKKNFKYLSMAQERRARAYAMIQEAKRRGISTDELIDMYTVEGELLGEAPGQLLGLSKVYTPENLKKYLKNFLSVATPVTLGLNAYENK